MIAKVNKGSAAVGLMYYLLGPGRDEEHVNPTVIGSWDGQPGLMADMGPSEIGRMLEVPLGVRDLDSSKRVWHTSLRNHADDRVLSNEEWVTVARDVLHRTGIAPVGDVGAARWVVVRHGEDHVHVAAVLARQDSGEPLFPRNDYVRAREACVGAEQELGLRLTNRDGHGSPGRSRPEEERVKAGGEDLRGRLRRAVQVAVAGSGNSDEFLGQLRSQGVMVETRADESGGVTGFRVAVPEAVPVWFGGSKLHRSLSWPQLQRQWEHPTGDTDGLSDEQLVEVLDQVVSSIGEVPVEELAGTDIPEATGALLRAAGHVTDGRFETGLTRAVDEYFRAVPEDRGTVVRSTGAGMDLRTIGAALLLGDRNRSTASRVILSALLLIQATATLRETQQRLAQAQAAERAAAAISEHTAAGARSSGVQQRRPPAQQQRQIQRPNPKRRLRPGPRRGPSIG